MEEHNRTENTHNHPHDFSQPFRILKNYRKKPTHCGQPKRKSSVCVRSEYKKQQPQKERKMTADIEIETEYKLNSPNEEQIAKHSEMKEQDEECLNIWNNDSLENVIPLNPSDECDVLYNLNSQSMESAYSKLERTLFGMNINQEQIHQE